MARLNLRTVADAQAVVQNHAAKHGIQILTSARPKALCVVKGVRGHLASGGAQLCSSEINVCVHSKSITCQPRVKLEAGRSTVASAMAWMSR